MSAQDWNVETWSMTIIVVGVTSILFVGMLDVTPELIKGCRRTKQSSMQCLRQLKWALGVESLVDHDQFSSNYSVASSFAQVLLCATLSDNALREKYNVFGRRNDAFVLPNHYHRFKFNLICLLPYESSFFAEDNRICNFFLLAISNISSSDECNYFLWIITDQAPMISAVWITRTMSYRQ